MLSLRCFSGKSILASLLLLFTGFAQASVFGCDNRYLQHSTLAHKSTAANFAIYALLSNNAYQDNRPKFELPNHWQEKKSKRHADKSGLAYQVYEKWLNGKIVEAVMVFRGTEFSQANDWLNGNFSSKQYQRAYPHIQRFMADYPNIRKTATGHSLGGGLAMFASYQFDGIDAVGFNASPRYHSRQVKKPNNRVIIFEKGDPTRFAGNVLFPWRWGGFSRQMDIYYQKYDFLAPGFIKPHHSYPLAKGLLLMGSLTNPELKAILEHNCNIKTYG